MSLESTLQRIAVIDRALADPAALIQGGAASAARAGLAGSGGTIAPGSAGAAPPTAATGSFAAALQQASAPASVTPNVEAQVRARIVSTAESQIGQAEQPPESNESPAISTYRSATAGAIPGAPWCAYFASWVARQAGAPIGSQGQGLGAVSEIWSWAQSTGRAIPNGPGIRPQPGDLIVFGDQHVGIVRAVLPNGQIETVEGNYENKVAANVRTPTEATGYVRMG